LAEAMIAVFLIDGHTWTFRADPPTRENVDDLLRQVAAFAADEDCRLNWFHAAWISRALRAASK
jgi:hypothetical protein